ncbi:Amuc_1098 family type IV pilus outer membrane protein [Sulfuriroseicoccus oceanibius]|uniref:Type II and III secretion system protein n=1 Tax=Sulfuriroseicoccus oceanibius TaxID=2707525 RepID=A0A6B3LB86_9BACT|nr:Amuc_1098 family type IV pilus outer membrane protein [Sulfuriroseicoccus oceanibius]QQL43951.1 type II and III secretion system protein [Sulfuriroseicoccus oceanibius]
MRFPAWISDSNWTSVRRAVRPVMRVAPAVACAALVAGSPHAAIAQDAASVEVDQRALRTAEARAFAEEGDYLMKQGDYAEASTRYREAVEFLPTAPITADLRKAMVSRYARAATLHAKQLTKEARYAEAKALLESVLSDGMAPNYGPAKSLQEKLSDGDAVNLADSPERQDKAASVLTLLKEAEFLELADDYDAAKGRYEDVLRLDKYNKAAQAGIERVEREKMNYAAVARTRTRAELVSEVDAGWETPKVEILARDGEISGRSFTPEEAAGRDAILKARRNLGKMVVDRVSFDEATVSDVLRFLTSKTRSLDPKGEGINFVLKDAMDAEGNMSNAGEKMISLDLRNVPVMEVVRYTARLAGLNYRIEPYAVVLSASDLDSDLLVVRSYRVRPDFISSAPTNAPADDDPFGNTNMGNTSVVVKRLSAKEFLERSGIPFDEGSTARFDAATSTLTMRNTAAAHQRLETLVEMSRTDVGRLVEIRVKMVEVNQTNLTELGFDWLLGGSDLGNGVVVTGGTGDIGEVPLTDPTTGGQLGENPVTASLRSGDTAITEASISSLVATGSPASLGAQGDRAPGVFGVSGVLTQPQFQMVMRGLNQKKGVDMLNAPHVVTRSGQVARVEVMREFIYPTEYDPPELPNAVRGDRDLGSFPVTPATPTAFDMKPLGTIMEVDPVVNKEGTLVELNVDLVMREFIGFVNYGSPITTPPIGGDLFAAPQVITENRILQPVFETRTEKTSVSVYDGQSLVIGGLLNSQVETVNDSVPFFGDIPVFGRFFKTRAEKTTKQALLIFVEVNVLDPSGRPLRDYAADSAVGAPGV